MEWIDKLQGNWSGDFADERQQATWNKASASAMYLMMWASIVAAFGFITVDANRYSSCALVLCLIAMGGPVYAQTVARRQNARPVSRVPSWPSMTVNALLFGITFFVITRLLDRGEGWRTGAISSVAVAVFWTVVMRFVLQRRHNSTVSPTSQP